MVSNFIYNVLVNNLLVFDNIGQLRIIPTPREIPLSHLPITRMRNRDQYGKSIRVASGLAVEESKMHTFSRI